jgi:LacI family transcriptional regulator
MCRVQPRIAIYLGLHGQHSHRILQGVLNYRVAHPKISVEDFCFFKDTPGFSTPVPPWTGRVDGAISGLAREEGVEEWIASAGVPSVNVCGNLMDSTIVSVVGDIDRTARTVVDHLFNAGYRTFLYVGCSQADDSRRYQAALAKLLKLKSCSLFEMECPTPFFWKSTDSTGDPKWDAQIMEVIKKAPKPLAIVGRNDPTAAGVCRIVRQLGFGIPEDVGIIGTGDTDAARIASPPITTIRCDFERMGYEAARLVHRMIQGNRPADKNISVPGEELIVRQSTLGNQRQRTTHTNIQDALELIRRKACEGITVAEIASQLHMSTRTFKLQFTNEVGRPVGAELRRVRLKRAKELLVHTELPLTRIAGLIGYGDSAYFATFFRQHEDQTPSEYRRRHRGN